jgi:hypothetical protein
MNPALQSILDQLAGAEGRLNRLVDELAPERWRARRTPDRWSVAECVAHLNLTTAAFLPEIDRGLADARAHGPVGDVTYRMDVAGRLLSWVVGPQRRIGNHRLGSVRTPSTFVPGGDLDRDLVMADFHQGQSRLARAVEASDGLPIDRVRLASPFSKRVRYNLYSTFVIIPRHQLRHIVQAEWLWGADPRP